MLSRESASTIGFPPTTSFTTRSLRRRFQSYALLSPFIVMPTTHDLSCHEAVSVPVSGERLVPRLVVEALRVASDERGVGLHDERPRMQRQPLRQRDLGARDLPQRASLPRAGDRFACRLPPPAARRPVLEHRVEVIHADEAERLASCRRRSG